jgi:hypothetical protein
MYTPTGVHVACDECHHVFFVDVTHPHDTPPPTETDK